MRRQLDNAACPQVAPAALILHGWLHVSVTRFAAVASRDLARVYFLSFYVIGVLLFLNIVVAFILDAFLSEYNKARSSRGW